jgi:hypothetical protein
MRLVATPYRICSAILNYKQADRKIEKFAEFESGNSEEEKNVLA